MASPFPLTPVPVLGSLPGIALFSDKVKRYHFGLWFSCGRLAAYYGPYWPGITALLAVENGYMQPLNKTNPKARTVN